MTNEFELKKEVFDKKKNIEEQIEKSELYLSFVITIKHQ